MKFIKKQMSNMGIDVVAFGYDGDPKFLKSQKSLLGFGHSKRYMDIVVCSEYDKVDIFSVQDNLHIAKNMKNRFLDTSDDLIIGKFIASPCHLLIIIKTMSKIEHNLSISDLNALDRMNYK